MKLYVDGEEVGSKEGSYQVPNWDGIDALGIGYDSKNPDHTLRGQMSLARIYARALTQEEIVAQRSTDAPSSQTARTYSFGWTIRNHLNRPKLATTITM